MSTACAPSTSAWIPMRFRSRHVKCMLMSRPVASRTRMAVGRTDMRTRPREPSLMSTISTPRSFRSLAPCTSFSILCPRGGSSSTVTRNSPASSLRCTAVGAAVVVSDGRSGISARTRRTDTTRAAARPGDQAVEGLAHGADVQGRGAAASADHPRSGRDHPGRVFRHVRGRGEVDETLAHAARQTGIGLDDDRQFPGLRQHLLEDVVQGARAHRAVGADGLDGQFAQRADHGGGGAPEERHPVIGERHLGHDRQVGQRADGQYRLLHLHGIGKGLHDEGVHPALEQPFRLLEEGGARVVRLHGAERRQVPAERPEGAQHEDVATHALADVPGQARPAPVDLAHPPRRLRASRA